jgi:hypothetical protein
MRIRYSLPRFAFSKSRYELMAHTDKTTYEACAWCDFDFDLIFQTLVNIVKNLNKQTNYLV